MRTLGSEAIFLKIRWFISFQKTQTQASQTVLKKRCEDRVIPAMGENWIKCCWITFGATEKIPNQDRTSVQTLAAMAQSRNMWWAVSKLPQPAAHAHSVDGIILLRNRLSFVGNLFQRRRQANNDIFAEMFLCQTSSTWSRSTGSSGAVNRQ